MGLNKNPVISGVAIHNQLTGRELADGHPIAAITSLNSELTGIKNNVTGLQNGKADKSAVIEKTNSAPFTPSSDYHPATKKYVDDNASDITAADVLTKTNTTAYTPTANYHPATKKYIDDIAAGIEALLAAL